MKIITVKLSQESQCCSQACTTSSVYIMVALTCTNPVFSCYISLYDINSIFVLCERGSVSHIMIRNIFVRKKNYHVDTVQ